MRSMSCTLALVLLQMVVLVASSARTPLKVERGSMQRLRAGRNSTLSRHADPPLEGDASPRKQIETRDVQITHWTRHPNPEPAKEYRDALYEGFKTRSWNFTGNFEQTAKLGYWHKLDGYTPVYAPYKNSSTREFLYVMEDKHFGDEVFRFRAACPNASTDCRSGEEAYTELEDTCKCELHTMFTTLVTPRLKDKDDTVYHHYTTEDGNTVVVSDLPEDAVEKERFLKEHKIIETASGRPNDRRRFHVPCSSKVNMTYDNDGNPRKKSALWRILWAPKSCLKKTPGRDNLRVKFGNRVHRYRYRLLQRNLISERTTAS